MRTYIHFIGSIFLGSFVAVTGCSSDTNNNNTGGASGGDVTLDDLGKELISIRCSSAVDCHEAESVAECESTSKSPITNIQQYLDDGTVVYHGDKAAACLDVFKKLGGCSYAAGAGSDLQKEIEAACVPVFEGTVAVGGNCFDDQQCATNNCVQTDPMCTMACCAGKCAAAPAATPVAKNGESCAMATCDKGLFCQTDMNGDPTTCAAQVATGQPCTDFDGCISPAICDIDFSTGKGTCDVPAAHGATCNPNSFFACDRYDDICDMASMKCVTKTLVGADCSMIECVDYASCDAMTNKCVKGLAEGATCDMNNDACLGDLHCQANSKCGFTTPTVCK